MKTKHLFIVGLFCFLLLFLVGATWYWYQPKQAATKPPREDTVVDIKQKRLACIAALPLTIRIGQKIMAAGYAAKLANDTPAFRAAHLGGVIIMNETSAESIAGFRAAMDIPPLVAVDQEGGTVQRYKREGSLPGAADMAAGSSAADAYRHYFADNTYLKTIGITTNFAPVVDVESRTPNPLPGRMYSNDPKIVASYAKASITAAYDAGLSPVIKHFPGLGSATGNTDFTTATTDPLSTLASRDLIPIPNSLHSTPMSWLAP